MLLGRGAVAARYRRQRRQYGRFIRRDGHRPTFREKEGSYGGANFVFDADLKMVGIDAIYTPVTRFLYEPDTQIGPRAGVMRALQT